MVSEWLKEKRKCEAYAGIIFGQKFQIPDNFDDYQKRLLLNPSLRKKSQGLP